MPDINTVAADLREVYLLAFDNVATDPSEVSDQFDGINTRYARELLGTLTTAGLLTTDEVEGQQAWQTHFSVDNTDRAEVIATIEKWLTEHGATEFAPEKAASAPRAKSPVKEPHPCLCGCDEMVPGKSFYRPGHDARHAGVIGRKIAANYTVAGYDRREDLAVLPSDRLKAKAEGIAEKAITKQENRTRTQIEDDAVKAARAAADKAVLNRPARNTADEALRRNVTGKVESGEAEPIEAVDQPVTEEGTVKVGKNEYAARRNTLTGRVDYFKGDDVVEASKTAAKTFTVEA